MAVQEAPTESARPLDDRCPTCGAPAETGQLICLECGSRIALSYRRPPSWRVPFTIVSLIVIAAAAGIYFGADALQDDADREVASQSAPSEDTSSGNGTSSGEGEAGGEEK